jgi:hypothetical protein
MAIASLDNIVAGFQPPQFYYKALSGTLVAGRPFSPFYTAGIPGAAVAPSPGLAGAALTTYAGQIPFTNPAGGVQSYLGRFVGASTAQAGTVLLCDRLWHNSGITITSAVGQSITSAAWPARDANGSTNGEGVMIGLEVSTATGAGTPTLTLAYTNSAGTTTRSGTNLQATAASSAIGTFHMIGLQAGDTGVRSIQTYTQSATWTSGAVHLVAYRVLAAVAAPVAGIGQAVDALTSGLPRIYDNTVPFLLFIPNTTTSTSIAGQMIVTQG